MAPPRGRLSSLDLMQSASRVALGLRRRPIPLATALRRALQQGYTAATLRADLMAGLVVGVVAIPLSMALAIAVGVPPEHGLYTAAVAGFIVALLGGSKHQVTGPTAAFIVILAPIVTKHGIAGLLTAGVMAGVLLIGMGFARMGQMIRFIPHPVTTGFTAGIATVIATLQIRDALGLSVPHMPDDYVGKVEAMWASRGTFHAAELGVACVTMALLLGIPRVTKRVPAPLVALTLVALGGVVLHRLLPSFSVATIGTRFHGVIDGHPYAGVPSVLPSPALPWGASMSFHLVRELFPSAFAIAILGAIESLLSAVVADGMTGKKHDPDAELVALGIGNLVAPFFGGIAATGALARTATNVRAGARTPVAAAFHAVVVILAIVLLAPLIAYVPMASLAALLLLVAWNMSETHHVVHIVRVAPKSDVSVLVVCFVLTVLFDMVVAVSVGVVLAALLFMRRMSILTQGRAMLETSDVDSKRDLPEGVLLYEIAGPLFFGAAKNAMAALSDIHDNVRVVIISLADVPVIDATGLVALESAIDSLLRGHKRVILAGPLPEPRRIFESAKLESHGDVLVLPTVEAAVESARASRGPSSTPGGGRRFQLER